MHLARSVRLIGLMAVATGTHSLLVGQEAAGSGCPTSALQPLLVTRGDWLVTWVDRVSPERYVTSQARATIEPSAHGCGLLERFEGTREGRPFAALSVVAPAGNDSLERVWQDSDHGALLLFRAAAQAQPLRFERSRDLGQRILRLRHSYRSLARDRFTTETELSPDGGETWQLVARFEYRRRGP